MDSTMIILIINFILQIVQMFDHSFIQRLKKSSCFGNTIEFNDNVKDITAKFQSNTDLQKIIDLLNNKKNDDIKIDIKD